MVQTKDTGGKMYYALFLTLDDGRRHCVLKTAHFDRIMQCILLIRNHGSILRRFPFFSLSGEAVTLDVSQDAEDIATTSLWPHAKEMIRLLMEAELTPPREQIIECEYRRL